MSKSHGVRAGSPQGEGEGKGMPSSEWVSRADTSCFLGNRADTGLTVH